MARDLRVLIDARMLMGRFSGVARMVTSFVDHLAGLHGLRVVALCGNEIYEPWRHRNDMECLLTDFSRSDRAPAARLWWEIMRLPHWIGQSGADVYHATWNCGVSSNCRIPTVLTVHDLIPWDEPARGVRSRFSRWCYRHLVRTSAGRADALATVSGFTANEIVQKLGMDPARIRIIFNGVGAPGVNVGGVDRSKRPCVLFVGGHEPRKNLKAVFRALDSYWTNYDPSLELRLTATIEQLDSSARDAYEKLANKQQVRFLGSPSDDQLAIEYSNATALVFLSRAEGFGLPALEAMAHGCPVIAARRGALPEVVGNAGILVDPDEPKEVSDAIALIRRSPQEIIARGLERAATFSWQRAAEAYVREYRRILEASRECLGERFAPCPIATVARA